MVKYSTLFAAIFVAALLSGCGSIRYYAQAINGHFDLMNRRVPIDELITAEDTPSELKRKLRLVSAVRDFASRELGLPANKSYSSYADLGRDYVVWNVFATPELSLEPIPSCFIFVGCLSYRGFFSPARANQFATELRAQGNDVFVGGVAAYSTLGWFDDPILNTMLLWDDQRIAEVIFHELAHQLIYAQDDTVFNESFATAVAEIGVGRWNSTRQDTNNKVPTSGSRRREFNDLLLQYRTKLEANYLAMRDDADKRARKGEIFEELFASYETLKQHWAGYNGYDAWMRSDLNNAKIASIVAYHDYVPAFQSILQTVDYDLRQFYAIATSLSVLTHSQRKQCLTEPVDLSACDADVASSQ
mgnify:CR=1 FL=1